jgi:hypothetical protein
MVRKCLERRVIARLCARDEAWSEPGNPHGRGVPALSGYGSACTQYFLIRHGGAHGDEKVLRRR